MNSYIKDIIHGGDYLVDNVIKPSSKYFSTIVPLTNGTKIALATDGVGSKLLLAEKFNKLDTIGIDLVAMSVNDIICSGAVPTAFLDYYSTPKFNKTEASDILEGIVEGCSRANISLVGGETSITPTHKSVDLAGFCVGEINDIEYPRNIIKGDILVGIPSSGVHANGLSLLQDSDNIELLEPTRIYLSEYLRVRKIIKGLAHVTGGGIVSNVLRVDDRASVDFSAWQIPEIFKYIRKFTGVTQKELREIYNCGIGLVAFVAKENVAKVTYIVKNSIVIGEVK